MTILEYQLLRDNRPELNLPVLERFISSDCEAIMKLTQEQFLSHLYTRRLSGQPAFAHEREWRYWEPGMTHKA